MKIFLRRTDANPALFPLNKSHVDITLANITGCIGATEIVSAEIGSHTALLGISTAYLEKKLRYVTVVLFFYNTPPHGDVKCFFGDQRGMWVEQMRALFFNVFAEARA